MLPLVSIIIPTYNRAHLISETLDSIINQTYPNWECIVVDDGSTDNTLAVLNNYRAIDSRVYYYERPQSLSKGGNICRNYGFNLSRGEFIKFLDSDDILSNDNIFEQIETIKSLNSNEGIVITSQWNYFNDSPLGVAPLLKKNNKSYKSGYDLLYDFGIYNTFYPPHVYLSHRSIFIKSGLWNEYLKINQDGEFFVRVLLNSSKIVYSNKGMVFYRFGYNSTEVNVSSFSNKEKKEHSILSWILIDTYLKLFNKEEKSIEYVINAKSIILKNLDDKILLKKHINFFKEVKNIDKYNFKGFLKKCLKIL